MLDAALRFGRGNLREALQAQRLWTWETQEILSALRALQEWNLGQPEARRVRFVGVDVQEPYSGVQRLIQVGHLHPALLTLTTKGQVVAGSDAAKELHSALIAVETREADSQCLSLARNARRFVEAYLLKANHACLGLRDTFMAETLLEEATDSAGLTMYWAHNEHVAINPEFGDAPSAGFVLRQQLGQAYRAVGILMGKGEFRARDRDSLAEPRPLKVFQIGPPAPHHSDALFGPLGEGLYCTSTLSHPGPRRFLGGHYGLDTAQTDPAWFKIERPLSDFDLIQFLPHTTAAQSLKAVNSAASAQS